MPPATRKAASIKSQQSKLTDAFRSSGTKITKPSSNTPKDVKDKIPASVTLLKSSPPPSLAEDASCAVSEVVLISDHEHDEDIVKHRQDQEEVDNTSKYTALGDKAVATEKELAVAPLAEVLDLDQFLETTVKRPILLPQEVPNDQAALARKISSKQIRTYLDTITKSRLAPTVHQEDLTVNEKVLRHFDLSSQYGPCIGITRFKRWNRANSLDLNPPLEVLAVLLQMQLGEGNQQEAKNSHVKETSGAMAHVNDLLVAHVES